MSGDELTLMIGGPQGSGLETTAQILTSSLAYLGYGVISDREYYSNITGRHSYIHMNVSPDRIPLDLTYPVRLLGAIDAETIFTHFEDLERGGYVIYDKAVLSRRLGSIVSMPGITKKRIREKLVEIGVEETVEALVKHLNEVNDITLVEIDFRSFLKDISEKFGIMPSKATRYTSSILVGALSSLINIEEDALEYGLRRRFGKREKLIQHNIYLIGKVSEHIAREYGKPLKLAPPKLSPKEMLVASGNDIVAMAKVVAGLRYQSYYPITPAADESFFLETYNDLGEKGSILVIQTEDELAAITSAIGAALAGARSATATSGPGFSLMVEGLGWAGINEVPVVITYYQRGGPATGLPTRGAQSDLMYSIFASHGEFARVVITSGDHIEAFYDTIEAFNLAEKYQVPVIHLLDKFLANSFVTMEIPDLTEVKIDRGYIVDGGSEYRRFDISREISPRAFIGSDAVMWYTGSEHDEFGHTNEDPILTAKMYEKRMKKLEIMDREIPLNLRVKYYGEEDPDYILVGWGFVKNTCIKTMWDLETEGLKGGYLHLKMFTPFPTKYVEEVLGKVDLGKIIVVEHDYMVQSAMAISLFTGIRIRNSIVKYNGRPIYVHELTRAIKDILSGKSNRVVLTYGA